jgi:hypothetical protein
MLPQVFVLFFLSSLVFEACKHSIQKEDKLGILEAKSEAVAVTKYLINLLKTVIFEKNSSFVARYETAVDDCFVRKNEIDAEVSKF